MTITTRRIPFEAREGLDAWPNGAKMAVLVYCAPEEWDWNDERSRPGGTSSGRSGRAPSLSTRTAVQYGFDVGLRRLSSLFREYDMKVTLWTSGEAVLQHREVLEELAAEGHELSAHSVSQGIPVPSLSRAEQEEVIGKSVELLESVAGRRPKGWIGPGAEATADTIELLAAAEFEYNADLQDDELPYFIESGGKTMVEIPYRMVGNINDHLISNSNVNSVSTTATILCDAFDAYHDAAQTHPLMFNYGTHPYVSGRPDGTKALRKLLEHVHTFDDVWVTNYEQIAAWWREQHEALSDQQRSL